MSIEHCKWSSDPNLRQSPNNPLLMGANNWLQNEAANIQICDDWSYKCCNPSCTSHVRESCEGNWFSQASVMVLLDNSAKGFVARAVAYRIKLQTVKRWLSQQILRECPKKYIDLIETQGIGPSVINRMPEQGPRLSHVQVKKRQPSAVLDHHGAPVVTSRTQDENIEL